jgi:hypothetical protein
MCGLLFLSNGYIIAHMFYIIKAGDRGWFYRAPLRKKKMKGRLPQSLRSFAMTDYERQIAPSAPLLGQATLRSQ